MSRLPIDLAELNESELRELNHKIVERLRFLRDAKAHHHMRELCAGARVSFTCEHGTKTTGTILRLNRKTVSLVDSKGTHWRVAPALLSRVETNEVEAEVFTKKPESPRPSNMPAFLPGLQFAPPKSPFSPPLSRNAPCPCGSGKKYKRCCADRKSLEFR